MASYHFQVTYYDGIKSTTKTCFRRADSEHEARRMIVQDYLKKKHQVQLVKLRFVEK